MSLWLNPLQAIVLLSSLRAGAATAACPMTTKVSCPLCMDIIEHWNDDGIVPARLDDYCDAVAPKWRASFETLTGKAFDAEREHTRCVAVSAGLQEMTRAGCSLPSCNPDVACSTFC